MIPREAYRDVPEDMRLALPAPFHPAELEGIFGPVNGVEGDGGGECLVCYCTTALMCRPVADANITFAATVMFILIYWGLPAAPAAEQKYRGYM